MEMTRPDLTEARWKIIRAANRHKLTIRRPGTPTLFGARQIQQAVFVCRQNRLVDDATLVAAGFKPNRVRPVITIAKAA